MAGWWYGFCFVHPEQHNYTTMHEETIPAPLTHHLASPKPEASSHAGLALKLIAGGIFVVWLIATLLR